MTRHCRCAVALTVVQIGNLVVVEDKFGKALDSVLLGCLRVVCLEEHYLMVVCLVVDVLQLGQDLLRLLVVLFVCNKERRITDNTFSKSLLQYLHETCLRAQIISYRAYAAWQTERKINLKKVDRRNAML